MKIHELTFDGDKSLLIFCPFNVLISEYILRNDLHLTELPSEESILDYQANSLFFEQDFDVILNDRGETQWQRK